MRRGLTGSTHNPRLTRKTSAKQISLSEEVDFEEEVEAYRKGAFVAPAWIKTAPREGRDMKEVRHESEQKWHPPSREGPWGLFHRSK